MGARSGFDLPCKKLKNITYASKLTNFKMVFNSPPSFSFDKSMLVIEVSSVDIYGIMVVVAIHFLEWKRRD